MIAKSHSVFVVVCRREAFVDWQEEAQKCRLPWTVVDFEKDLCRSANTKVWLVSHGMLSGLLDQLVAQKHLIEAVCYDEGFLYKNKQTLHCQAANILSSRIEKAAIISGNMMTAKNLEDVFGQLYAIYKNEWVARTLTEFRTKYMFGFQIDPINRPNALVYTGKRGATKLVAMKVKRIASVYFPSDTDRKIVQSIRNIYPTDQQQSLMERLKQEYFVSLKGKDLELRNAPSLITKCQQISDGFLKMGKVYDLEHNELEDGPIIEFKSAKLFYLIQEVAELVSCGEKVVIWCAFKQSVQIVLQSLQTHLKGIKSYGFYGTKKFDIAGWRRNGQVAVGTEASGSSVNHFANCAYAIYYSMDFHWLHLNQSQGRTNRGKGSTHPTCYYYYLHTRTSLDSLVYRTAVDSGAKEKQLIDLTQLKQWLTH